TAVATADAATPGTTVTCTPGTAVACTTAAIALPDAAVQLVAVHAAELVAALLGAAAELLARLRSALVAAAVVLLRDPLVLVRDALAVLGLVVEVAVVDVGLVEVVVLVDVDVDVVATPVAIAPDRGADEHAGREREPGRVGVARRVHVVGRVGRIRPRAVDRARVVGRDVHRLGLRGLDHVDRLVLDRLGLDRLLGSRLQVARLVRLAAQRLHRRQHGRLVGEECVAELL